MRYAVIISFTNVFIDQQFDCFGLNVPGIVMSRIAYHLLPVACCCLLVASVWMLPYDDEPITAAARFKAWVLAARTLRCGVQPHLGEYRVIQNEEYTFKNLFYKNYWH
jgi:hypothetical protein